MAYAYAKGGVWQGVELLESLVREHREEGGMAVVATHVPIRMKEAMLLEFPKRYGCPQCYWGRVWVWVLCDVVEGENRCGGGMDMLGKRA